MVDAEIVLLPRPDGTRPAQDGPDKLHRFLLAPSLMTDSRATTSRFAPFAIAVACLCLAACSDDGAAARGEAPAEVVTTTTLALQPWHDRIRALGTVKARESVAVTAKVSETVRSEEHTSELQSLMRSSYAVFCLKKKRKLKHTPSSAQHINSQLQIPHKQSYHSVS